jgi:hypothetical protein
MDIYIRIKGLTTTKYTAIACSFSNNHASVDQNHPEGSPFFLKKISPSQTWQKIAFAQATSIPPRKFYANPLELCRNTKRTAKITNPPQILSILKYTQPLLR